MAKGRKHQFIAIKVIEDLEEIASASLQRISTEPTDRREAYVLAVNSWSTFSMLMSSFQLRWRYKIGDAAKTLQDACDISNNTARFWRRFAKMSYTNIPTDRPYTPDGIRWTELPESQGAVRFQFATAALLEILTLKGPTEELMNCVPTPNDWKLLPDRYASSYVDSGLVIYLITGKRPKGWDEIIGSRYRDLDGGDTAIRTYNLYDRIIHDRKKLTADGLQRLVEEGDKLFLERANASEGVFTAWEGKDQCNVQCLDFRLAAILKHCFRDDPNIYASIKSVHKYSR